MSLPQEKLSPSNIFHFVFETYPSHHLDVLLFEDVTNSAELLKKLINLELEGAFMNPEMV
jgi:hypothetical protein